MTGKIFADPQGTLKDKKWHADKHKKSDFQIKARRKGGPWPFRSRLFCSRTPEGGLLIKSSFAH